MLKKFTSLFLVAALGILSVACTTQVETKTETASSTVAENTQALQDNKIIIGASATPHAVILEGLQEEFKKVGLEVTVQIFEDYVQPNLALADGSLDANYFQHLPYFESFSKEHNLNLAVLGNVHIEPMGLYSTKYKSLDELQDGDEILIPNDVTNLARALLILDQNGLIKLSERKLDVTVENIVENKKNLKLTPVTAATIPSAYVDVAAGVINANYVISAGIDPSSAIVRESGENNPYANLVAVRAGEESKEKFARLYEVLSSETAKAFIEKEFKGEVLPAFSK